MCPAPVLRERLPPSSRYELLARIAAGGMATVFAGRLRGARGFRRLVAIKRAHPHLVADPAFGRMLAAEAKVASRVHHPNAVAVHDVEELDGELLLVMDYVEGASVAELVASAEERGERLVTACAVRMILDACAGLHAAHQITDDDGRLLHLVHRDVTPHNLLVGVDGITRISDFGIAKALHGEHDGATATGALRGKIAYMAPEYIEHGEVTVRGDVFALGVVTWEILTGRRLFRGANDMETLRLVAETQAPPPSSVARDLAPALDEVLLRAVARDPVDRFASAEAFGEALEGAAQREGLVASHAKVGALVRELAREVLEERSALLREDVESTHGEVSVGAGADAPVRTETVPAPLAPPAPEVIAPRRSLGPGQRGRRWTPLAAGGALLLVAWGIFTVTAHSKPPPAAPQVTEAMRASIAAEPAQVPSVMPPSAPSEASPAPSAPSAAAQPALAVSTPRSRDPRSALPAPKPAAAPPTARPTSAEPPASSVDRAPPNPYAP